MKEKLHIIPHDHAINKEDREKLNGHRSKVLWFVGLSGSGKSTLAGRLEQELYSRGIKTMILDGDNVRAGLNSDLDFSDESRVENIRRISHVAKLIADSGVVVLTAFITPFEAEREKVKQVIGSDCYTEIFVECPVEVCEQRDVKGLYKKARAGEISNFTGISSPFEEPKNPDFKVSTHEVTIEEGVNQLLDNILESLQL